MKELIFNLLVLALNTYSYLDKGNKIRYINLVIIIIFIPITYRTIRLLIEGRI